MSPLAWLLVHVFGVVLLFTALGALLGLAPDDARGRKLASALHGLALLVTLVAGGALLGRPTGDAWIVIKAAAWLVLGAAPVVVRRAPQLRPVLLVLLPLVGLLATWAALYKPGA